MVCGPPFLSTEQIELERARECVPSARLEFFFDDFDLSSFLQSPGFLESFL